MRLARALILLMPLMYLIGRFLWPASTPSSHSLLEDGSVNDDVGSTTRTLRAQASFNGMKWLHSGYGAGEKKKGQAISRLTP